MGVGRFKPEQSSDDLRRGSQPADSGTSKEQESSGKPSGDAEGSGSKAKGDADASVKSSGKEDSVGKKLAKGKAAADAGVGGAKVAAHIALLNYLKFLAASAAKAAGSWLSGFIGTLVSIGKGLLAFAGTSVFAAALVFGGPVAAAAIGGVVVYGVVSNHSDQKAAERDELVKDCDEIERNQTQPEMIEGNKEDYINKVYSVIVTYGGTLNEAAGILGNFDAESGIDPTGVETVYTEPYQIGPKKQHVIDSGYDPAVFKPSYHSRFPKIKLCGIGLGQWTNERNTMLREYAEGLGSDWWDIGTQLGFMISKDSRAEMLRKWIEDNRGSSIDTCTQTFMYKWEGIHNNTLGKRKDRAASIALKLKSMEIDEAYGNSVIQAAQVTAVEANEAGQALEMEDCEEVDPSVGNDTIADALVAYAYATEAEGRNNNGTSLYQYLHRKIWPGDGIFMSCDRGVATAVRWCGADDDFPRGPTGTQRDYLQASDKWKEVTEFTGKNADVLQPGDILVAYPGAGHSHGHIIGFVGNEAARKKYPDSDKDLVSASYMSRSPGLGYAQSTLSHDSRSYKAFRNTQTEAAPKYKNIKTGQVGKITPISTTATKVPNDGSHLTGPECVIACADYYASVLDKAVAKGEKWVYSNRTKYVKQKGTFETMLKGKIRGGNCASLANWAFRDMGIISPNEGFYGDSNGNVRHYNGGDTKIKKKIDKAVDVINFHGKKFSTLVKEGKIQPGDIIMGKGHTFIYRGSGIVFASGHDSKWHTDPGVKTDDSRKAVFESWVRDYHGTYDGRFSVRYVFRVKSNYTPKYFRDADGNLVRNK